MNYKQTLLTSPQIDAVRDKTLSFGVEALHLKEEFVDPPNTLVCIGTDLKANSGKLLLKEKSSGFIDYTIIENLKIIGHPITYADLLRALPIQYNVRHGGDKLGITVAKTTVFSIPLNYRTIEDIPEDDPCWEQLCKVFGLTK